MKNNILQISIAGALALCLLCLVDPFMLWMPGMVAMSVLFFASLLLLVWAGFVMRERASDEREAMHRMNAGRIAYLAGGGVLTVALFWQGISSHHIDPWVALALATMVLSKLFTHLYTDIYQ